MKLLDLLFGKKKKLQHMKQTVSTTSLQQPASRKTNSTVQSNSLPENEPDINRSTCQASERAAFQGQSCKDNIHDFVWSYPFTCRNCGLKCSGDTEEFVAYMGSFFDGTSYKWNGAMQKADIVSFFLSTGNRPVFEANCDFSHLSVRNCLNGSRDGWMQAQYPADYFEPKSVKLENADISRIKECINQCNFSAWITPEHYAKNQIMGACGFHADETFTCRFANGSKFTCLKPDNPEFKQLVSLLREIAEKNAEEKDQTFIKRMLQDTEKKEKQIYWLIGCSHTSNAEERMALLKQAVPYFNYTIARNMKEFGNANAQLMVNVIRFSDTAEWVTEIPVPESEYHWEPLPIGSGNNLAAALSLLIQRFKELPEPQRPLFPIVVLVPDGPVTGDWKAEWKRFHHLPGVKENVGTIILTLGSQTEREFVRKTGGILINISNMEDIITELDNPMLSL